MNQPSNDSTLLLEEASKTTDLFALLCQRKGWTDEYLSAIDNAEHDSLKDLDTLVAALEDIRLAGGTITIAPDFDMDGIASGVLGYAGLKELGFNVNLHIPDYRRGHDLTVEDITEIHDRYPDTTALLTCDGGVNSHPGIAAARALGWTTMVTDHHQELEPGSSADITVDPCRIDETYALPGICGAHVLYQVLQAYALAHQPFKLWAIRLLRLFAGLGTISDVMPILYENRQLVRDSRSIARLLWVPAPKTHQYADPEPDRINVEHATLMQLLRNEPHDPAFIAAFEGFAVMLKAFAIGGKVRDIDSINEGFYGFYVAPAMNSPRRTGSPLEDCFAVFTGQSAGEKLAAMDRVIENNEVRKELTTRYMEEIVEGDQPLAPWVYFSGANHGMFGLLASQIMRANGHPVVVLARPATAGEPVSGSARAPGWFDVIATLDGYENLTAIGHRQACGVKLASAAALDQLVTILADATRVLLLTAGDNLGPAADLTLGPDEAHDAPLTDAEPLIELVRRLETLRPFGHGFTEPVVELVVDPATARLDRIGSERQHLRLLTHTGMALLWWNAAANQGDRLDGVVADPAVHGPARFIGKLQLNTFRGETRLQAVINEQL
ncbi:DHH family phosphoesterase [Arthrobacter castelli]|uniref:DHH family phosphoesterase n=1 Tax=Arthrobacter castelli TaxID=271431 RepID=UPI00041E9C97|nr:DHH family phosphoesterase [Arthrobacter castelli]